LFYIYNYVKITLEKGGMIMKDLSDYLLRYEYTFVFDLEGMPSLELSYGSKDIELISGESLEMPWHEVVKSKIVNIEIIDDND
jgi:hypothetical protein